MAKGRERAEELKRHVDIVQIARKVGIQMGFRVRGNRQIVSPTGQFDSIVLYPDTNSYYRWSTGTSGDVIAFVQELGLADSFSDACGLLDRYADPEFTFDGAKTDRQKEDETYTWNDSTRDERLRSVLDEDSSQFRARSYLIRERGIDPSIVNFGIRKGYIKQVHTHSEDNEGNPISFQNVAFCTYRNDCLVGLCYRGIDSGFKMEDKGSDRKWGWVWQFNQPADKSRMFVFEGYIDMLSYLSFLRENGHDFKTDQNIYLSLGSATKYKNAVNVAEYYGINDMVISLDNDKAGITYSDRLENYIESLERDRFRNELMRLSDKYQPNISRTRDMSEEDRIFYFYAIGRDYETVKKEEAALLIESPEYQKLKKERMNRSIRTEVKTSRRKDWNEDLMEYRKHNPRVELKKEKRKEKERQGR